MKRALSPQDGNGPDGAKVWAAPLLSMMEGQLAKLSACPLLPGLYIVSTPIGNLADISLRALCTLASADMVFCEDTRHSRKLFSAYGIPRRLEIYHDFSDEADRARIVGALLAGKSVALISDAGTPLIADPGYKLVRDALAASISVFAVPGPSAVITALVTSGFETDQFHFGGFLPAKDAARLGTLEALRNTPGTLIFYDTAPRLRRTLAAIARVFPDRSVAVARELTKLHEQKLSGTAQSLADELGLEPLKGEIAVLIGPGRKAMATQNDAVEALKHAMKSKTLKEAVDEVAKGLGVPRKMVYNLALKMRDNP